jgi:hypothetical protein
MSGNKRWHVTLRDDLKWYSDDGNIVRIGPFRREDSTKIAQMLNSTDEIRDLFADWYNHQDLFQAMSYVNRQLKCNKDVALKDNVQPSSEKTLDLAECKKELELMDFMDTVPEMEEVWDITGLVRELEELR